MRKLTACVLVLMLAGCCTCRDGYNRFLLQVKDNLQNDIRPKYEKALKATDRDPDLIENDLGLVDDTVSSIDIIVKDGPPEEKKEEAK